MRGATSFVGVIAALVLWGCGGDDSSDSTPPADEEIATEAPAAGPNELLRQGTAPEGVNFATSPGGVTLDLNDLATPELTGQVQGSAITVTCQMESGSEVVVGEGEWPADAGNATPQQPDFDALSSEATASCTLTADGSDVATAAMEPVGP